MVLSRQMAKKPEKTYYLSGQKYHEYKAYLLAYAVLKYQMRKREKTIVIREHHGTIFSHKHLEPVSFFTVLFAIHTVIQRSAEYIVRMTPFYQPYPTSYRSKKNKKITKVQKAAPRVFQKFFHRVSQAITPTTNFFGKARSTTNHVTTTISEKAHATQKKQGRWLRLLHRWNRKKRLQFIGELRTQSENFKQNWLANILLAPFKPFYYSIRLYPLHSFFAVVLSGLIFGGTYGLHEIIFRDLPSVIELSTREPAVSSKILDRNGKILYRIYKDENRTIVPLTQISPHLIHATIAIEDKDFYEHHGFSIRGIARAAVANFQEGVNISQGGSTITQQLVKLRLLSSERTWVRKIKEVILSILVEGTFTKEEILSMYLNQVPYGGSTYGIEEAAQRYFGKHAKDLTLAESALLAGLPAAPSVYSPFGPNSELAETRQHEVLRRMVEDLYITQLEANEAMQQKLAYRENQIDILAPHFVMYVRELLAKEYGEESLLTQGLEIRTSIDLELQNKVQETVTKEVNDLKRLRISNGASLVTNPQTGEVLAMVGSINYFDFEHDGQVNVTVRSRQPGSSIKPLVYAMALERGNTVTSLIKDEPVTYNIAGSPPYSPKNYDGKFHGQVPLKEALASSYNIPAVKMLENVGVTAMITKGEAMGITTWSDRKRFGLSLTLGGGEVKMVDMASVYSAFANQGVATPLNPILEVKNYKGEVLYHNSCALEGTNCNGKKVLDPKIAFLISNILSDNNARTPAFGALSDLFIPGQEVAVKTGTTNLMVDNWTIGYTSDRMTLVWVGNNNGNPMSYVASGVTGASPIWNKIMRMLLDDENPHKFPIPSGVVKVATCFKTGTLPCGGCSKVSEEFYISGTEPDSHCNIARKSPDETPSSVATEIPE
jgi:1A family penicillin-binding protein